MSAVNCPMCELRFTNKNERDWHLTNEHHHPHHHRAPEGPRPVPGPAVPEPEDTDRR